MRAERLHACTLAAALLWLGGSPAQEELRPSVPLQSSNFGASIDIDGDLALVGAPFANVSGGGGAAYVFARTSTGWTEEAVLAGAGPDELFGTSVAIDGETALVGASRATVDGIFRAGTAYVFVRDGSTWDLQATFVASDAFVGDEFGEAVALCEDTALVGAPEWGVGTGATYVFVRDGTSWTEEARLNASNAFINAEFGGAVALDGERALIGARDDDTERWDRRGSAYVFERTGTEWTETAHLFEPATAQDIGRYGSAVALDGDTLAIGAEGERRSYVYQKSGDAWQLQARLDEAWSSALALEGDTLVVEDWVGVGVAHVYLREGSTWTVQPPLVAAAAENGDGVADAIAIDGNTVWLGARRDDEGCDFPGNNCNTGVVYLIEREPARSPELEREEFVPPSGAQGDGFATVADRSGDTLIVGSPTYSAAEVGQGAAFVFRRDGSSWAEEGVLVAPDAEAQDRFGAAVCVVGERAAVGAPGASPFPTADGAVYVFGRDGTQWSFEAKLISGGQFSGFGSSVALMGERVIAGRPFVGRGRVNVYVEDGGTWSIERILRPMGIGLDDEFGHALDADEATLVVGAWRGGGGRPGVVHVFDAKTWTPTELQPASLVFGDLFGTSLKLTGERLAVGARGVDEGLLNNVGATYVFRREGPDGLDFVEEALLRPEEHFAGPGRFGSAVDLEGERALISAPDAAGRDDLDAGCAYIFERVGTTWRQGSRLASSRLQSNLAFGDAVVLDGPRAWVSGPTTVPTRRGLLTYKTGVVPFPSFCDASDGALASCPCANPGAPDSGCDLSQGGGGVRLEVLAQQTSPTNRFTLLGTGYAPSTAPAAIAIRSQGLDPAAPVVFGDGLRCIGLPVVRLAATAASGGVSFHPRGHPAMDGAGEFFYQLWFRNGPEGYCGPGRFNLSNGRRLLW